MVLRTLALAAGLLFACGRETRSLVPIDITGPADADLASVSASVSQNGAEMGRRMLPWTTARGGTLKIGIYLPSTVAGTVEVTVAAGDAGGATYDAGPPVKVVVQSGKAAALVAVTLKAARPSSAAPDGGARATLDGGAVADAPPPPATGSDGPVRDTPPPGAADGATPATTRRWSAPTNIENDPLNASYDPRVAIHPTQEHVLVAWWETDAIKVRRFDAAAGTWGNVQTLENRGKPEGVQIGLCASGHALAVWRQTEVGRRGIWASHSGDSGVTWSPPAQVHDQNVDFQVQLALADSGDARAVWEEADFLNTEHTVWSAAFNATTGAWLPAAAVAPSGPVIDLTYGHQARVAMDGAGAGVLVWRDRIVPASGQENHVLYAAPFKGATALGKIQIIVSDPAYKTYPVPVLLPGGGRTHVIWTEYAEGLWESDYDGAGWKAAARITAGDPRTPALVVDSAGVFTGAWNQSLAGGSTFNVVAARSLAGAGGWNTPAPLETTNLESDPNTGNRPGPSLGVDRDGTVHAAWRRQTSDRGSYSVIVRTYAGGQWQPELELAPRTDLAFFHPQIAVARTGAAALATHLIAPPGKSDPESFNVFVALFR